MVFQKETHITFLGINHIIQYPFYAFMRVSPSDGLLSSSCSLSDWFVEDKWNTQRQRKVGTLV